MVNWVLYVGYLVVRS